MMSYINRFELIKAIMNGVHLDQAQLISTVDRQKVLSKIYKSEPELQDIGKFIITDNPIEEENWSKMAGKDKEKILKLNSKLKKSINLDKVIIELTNYKEKYHNVPTIYNYLTIAYHNTNQTKKYYESLIETVEKFPNYLFGKISLSEYYLNNNEFNKIPRLLDNKFEITQHFPPGTDIFHISAVRGFYFITGRYFAKAGKIEKAYKSYFLLSDLDNNHQTTEILGQEILSYELDIFKKETLRGKQRGIKIPGAQDKYRSKLRGTNP
jgi:tetratricopeptide (TPR) repeat protein